MDLRIDLQSDVAEPFLGIRNGEGSVPLGANLPPEELPHAVHTLLTARSPPPEPLLRSHHSPPTARPRAHSYPLPFHQKSPKFPFLPPPSTQTSTSRSARWALPTPFRARRERRVEISGKRLCDGRGFADKGVKIQERNELSRLSERAAVRRTVRRRERSAVGKWISDLSLSLSLTVQNLRLRRRYFKLDDIYGLCGPE